MTASASISTRQEGLRRPATTTIVDSPLTKVVGNTAKVISWYDNEWGYSNRVRDLILFLAKKGL